MKVDIYRSKKDRKRKYFIPRGTPVAILPEKVEEKIFKQLELSLDDKPRICLNSKEAIKAIKDNGYYMVEVSIRFTETIAADRGKKKR